MYKTACGITYYRYDHYYEQLLEIGNYNDFIEFISCNVTDYIDPERWDIPSFRQQNVTQKDLGWRYDDYRYDTRAYFLRQYTYFMKINSLNEYITINLYDYKNDIINYVNKNGSYHISIFHRFYTHKKRRYTHRKYHSSWTYKHRMPKTAKIKRYNSIPEMKEYVRQRDKLFPNWWDDTSRRISCSWKDQYKTKKQYDKNLKNTSSIRYFQEYEEYDMDELLQEDFLKNIAEDEE